MPHHATTDLSLLDITLAAARRDTQMVTTQSQPMHRLLQDVVVRPLTVHVDGRGALMEMFDLRWMYGGDPVPFVYSCMIRPGFVKGWNLHRAHEDRYIILQGDMEVVMFDPRPDSSTYGQVSCVLLSERAPSIINVPRNVWHADHNVGTKDALFVNLPTVAYDHANPDKYRLPIDTNLIPHSFPGAKGW